MIALQKHLQVLADTNVTACSDTTKFSAQSVTFFGIKAFVDGVPTKNDSNVYVGINSTELPIEVPPGLGPTIPLTSGGLALAEIYFKAETAGDGIYIIAG